MTLPEILRARRREKGMTMKHLGSLLGYSPKSGESTVQQWETGARRVPVHRWRALSEALDLPLEVFLPD